MLPLVANKSTRCSYFSIGSFKMSLYVISILTLMCVVRRKSAEGFHFNHVVKWKSRFSILYSILVSGTSKDLPDLMADDMEAWSVQRSEVMVSAPPPGVGSDVS